MRFLFATLLCAIFAVGCGSGTGVGDVDASLTDHPDPLTDMPGDLLFDVDILDAPTSYPLLDVTLALRPAGGTLLSTEFTHVIDANGDGMLGTGDTLRGLEGPIDRYNPTTVGAEHVVSLSVDEGDGRLVELWRGSWLPN